MIVQRPRDAHEETGNKYQFPGHAQLYVSKSPLAAGACPILVCVVNCHSSPEAYDVVQKKAWDPVPAVVTGDKISIFFDIPAQNRIQNPVMDFAARRRLDGHGFKQEKQAPRHILVGVLVTPDRVNEVVAEHQSAKHSSWPRNTKFCVLELLLEGVDDIEMKGIGAPVNQDGPVQVAAVRILASRK